ncbi:MAG: hypothetical protein GC137_06855 [Alphaproteobacteria bacterium]|nr:hypothetical protein [Alphaproteobacteria bacterium]
MGLSAEFQKALRDLTGRSVEYKIDTVMPAAFTAVHEEDKCDAAQSVLAKLAGDRNLRVQEAIAMRLRPVIMHYAEFGFGLVDTLYEGGVPEVLTQLASHVDTVTRKNPDKGRWLAQKIIESSVDEAHVNLARQIEEGLAYHDLELARDVAVGLAEKSRYLRTLNALLDSCKTLIKYDSAAAINVLNTLAGGDDPHILANIVEHIDAVAVNYPDDAKALMNKLLEREAAVGQRVDENKTVSFCLSKRLERLAEISKEVAFHGFVALSDSPLSSVHENLAQICPDFLRDDPERVIPIVVRLSRTRGPGRDYIPGYLENVAYADPQAAGDILSNLLKPRDGSIESSLASRVGYLVRRDVPGAEELARHFSQNIRKEDLFDYSMVAIAEHNPSLAGELVVNILEASEAEGFSLTLEKFGAVMRILQESNPEAAEYMKGYAEKLEAFIREARERAERAREVVAEPEVDPYLSDLGLA